MASEIVLATRSRDKAAEISEIVAAASSAKLISLNELDVKATPHEDTLEIHDSFVDNAIAKARYFATLTARVTLADDSGLMVDALDGGPGVRTKRFAADHGIHTDDQDRANNDLLLDLLHHVPDDRRGAHYVCAAALAWPGGGVLSTIGTCSGVITRMPIGAGGFGYDPLFMIPDLRVTFAQLTRAQKNQRSHRAHAVRAIAPHLK